MEKKSRFTSRAVFSAFGPGLLSEKTCKTWALKMILGSARCPRCGAKVPAKSKKKFWQNQQTWCAECRQKIFAASSTFLHATKLDFRQIILIAIFTDLGLKTGEISRLTGVEGHAVAKWRRKLTDD